MNSKLTKTESEKSSLSTVIRFLNEEQENISCTSKKCRSCQEHQTRNSWRVADTKIKSRREDQQINLQKKFSALLEDDEEAEKNSSADYSQTLPQVRTSQPSSEKIETNKVHGETSTVDPENQRRLTNTQRKSPRHKAKEPNKRTHNAKKNPTRRY